ncbi:MAG: MlaD family protein [Chthoniobacterales bacterium]
MPSENSYPYVTDHGKITAHGTIRLSWVWLFPLLALLTTAWFFWNNWHSEGPTIEVEFHEAPGIQANKTLLFYRGVAAGEVIDVRLDEHLSKAIVTIRLKAFASPLSQAGTLYWIDQPVISLAKTSGLSSIIQGNSLQARLGEGPRTTHFVGMEKTPLHPLEPPGLILKLTAQEIPYLEEGSPITYRGVSIGGVMRKELMADGNSVVIAAIQKQYVRLIHSNSHFWMIPAASLKIGPNGVQAEIQNLKSMFLGTVAVDTFETPAEEAKSGESFHLAANEQEARVGNEEVRFQLHASEIPTLYVGAPILYRGVIVGKIEKKEVDEQGVPCLTILIQKEFANTVHEKTVFWRLPGTKIQAGPGIVTAEITSLQALLQGGIAYDSFSLNKDSVAVAGKSFQLFSSEQVARLTPEPLRMSFDEGQGLLAGQTQVRYLGLPIGLVEEVHIAHHRVEVTAYLAPGYDFLRAPQTNYSIVRPKLGFDGLSGIETLVSGVYIECSRPKKPSKPFAHVVERLWSKVVPRK